MVCHGNHAFKHSQNESFSWGQIFWDMPGLAMNNLTQVESCPGVARLLRPTSISG